MPGSARRRSQPLVAAAAVSGDLIEGQTVQLAPPLLVEPNPIETESVTDDATTSEHLALVEGMLGPEWASALGTVETAERDAEQTGNTPRDRKRIGLIGGGAALMLTILAVTTLHIVGTHDRLNRTRDTLATTETELEDTTTELGKTIDDLSSTQSDLKTRTSERDRARSELSDTQDELDTTVAALSDARGKVDLQASVIEDLRTCLDGIASAALYMSDGYYISALDELNRVEPACDRANSAVV